MKINLILSKAALEGPSLGEGGGGFKHVKGIWQLHLSDPKRFLCNEKAHFVRYHGCKCF